MRLPTTLDALLIVAVFSRHAGALAWCAALPRRDV